MKNTIKVLGIAFAVICGLMIVCGNNHVNDVVVQEPTYTYAEIAKAYAESQGIQYDEIIIGETVIGEHDDGLTTIEAYKDGKLVMYANSDMSYLQNILF